MSGSVDSVPAILAVDDHDANLFALRAVLDPLGFRMVSARSGAEALERLAEQDYVLILMDVHMPGLDGYQTVGLIRQRERWRNIPIVFLTAVHDRPEHIHRGYALGAVDYVAKPVDPEVLRAKVRALASLYLRGERAERERRQEAERLKDLFLGAVGHDLRGPLGAVLLGSLLIQRDTEARPAHVDHARKIERAAKRMEGIIEDILDLTRGQFMGGLALAPRAADLGDLCRAAVEECRVGHPRRGLRVELSGDLAGRWDPDRLSRVLSNLVGNAVDHGAGEPIGVRATGRGDEVTLEVHNGGAPIEPALLPVLFDPFRRGESGRKGLGLGLYIVREIVHAHGGIVEVTSTSTEGTTFAVTLPRRVPPGEQGRQPPA